MNTHVVKRFDSPFSIAARYTGAPQRMKELLAANPQKRTVITGLGATFESLHVGETLALPKTWITLPHHGSMQGLGATGYWKAATMNDNFRGVPSWDGFGRICGELAYAVYRNSSGLIVAQTGGAVTNPNGSSVPRALWQWIGQAPSDPSQLPVPPGLSCESAPIAPSGPVTAGGGGGYGYRPNPGRGPHTIMGLGACTPSANLPTLATAINNLTAVLQGGAVFACSGAPGTLTSSQEVCDAQAAYQAEAATLGLTPIPLDASGLGPIDGEAGSATITALNSYLSSVGATFSFACNGGLLAYQGTLQQLSSTPGATGSTATTPTQLNAAYTALVTDTSLCANGAISTAVLSSVTAFQNAYNGFPGSSPIPTTGVFDTATFNALNQVAAAAGYKPFAYTCSAGYLTYTGEPGTQTNSSSSSTSSSSGAAVAIAALALAGAAGGWYLMSKHGPRPMLAHARVRHAPARRHR